jgi:hypothetical protein
MGPKAGTFVAIGAVVGSTATSGTSEFIFGLFDDLNGKPNNELLSTANAAVTFSDPSALHAVQTGGYETNGSGYNGVLAANTTYWVYMLDFAGGTPNGDVVGVSSAQCYSAGWVNIDPPTNFAYAQTVPVACPSDYAVYVIASFP